MSTDRRGANITPKAANTRVVMRARRFIERSFSTPFSLAELAVQLEISPRALRNAFRREFGMSPSQYHLSMRIRESQRLFQSGVPIKQIAADVGFFDQAHFTRQFKRITGKTPAQYASQRSSD